MADMADGFRNAAKAVGSAVNAMTNSHVCTQCGYIGRPTTQSSFSGCFFLVLLLFFIVPGILYAVYTMTHTKTVCPRCKAQNSMIPNDTPKAMEMRRVPSEAEQIGNFCPHCGKPVGTSSFCPSCGGKLSG
jgi:hypothetical protein